MVVAGVMSGTSADGIDVALVRIGLTPGSSAKGSPSEPTTKSVPRLRLLAHVALPYPPPVRRRVLEAMNGKNQSVAELSQLHWRLGQIYADAVAFALEQHPMRIDLIGCHGQTVYHQGAPKRFLGGEVACTWQIGEASVIAARLGVPVVSDFRPADMAVGGQGAPLVPLLDEVIFRHPKRNRVLQNLGGIGNLTVVAAGAPTGSILAFDTGPGNMVIDAVMDQCFHKPYDAGGRLAARGRPIEPVLWEILRQRFFRVPPPKSAGREQFGREFAESFLARCLHFSPRKEDAVATATALTARSIGLAWARFVRPILHNAPTDYVVAGGGSHNNTLIQMISEELAASGGINITNSDTFGIPTAAKESMAFALLAWQTWHGFPGNLPAATGAHRPVVLGKITYA